MFSLHNDEIWLHVCIEETMTLIFSISVFPTFRQSHCVTVLDAKAWWKNKSLKHVENHVKTMLGVPMLVQPTAPTNVSFENVGSQLFQLWSWIF